MFPQEYNLITILLWFKQILAYVSRKTGSLLGMVGPYTQKKNCRSRETISSERLLVTLRYLASGDSQQSQSFNFRLGRSTVCQIIWETCKGMWDALKEFFKEWDFPHCLGALGGKHIDCNRLSISIFTAWRCLLFVMPIIASH